MPEKDDELAQALKQAKGKKMFFAFVPKGSDGKLIVSKAKIPPKRIADAKKEIGGGTAVTGKCFGPISSMVFQVAKEPPATLGTAIKKVAHRDAGLTIVPEVQLASDADVEEVQATDAAAAGAGAGLAEFTTRLKALMPDIQRAQTAPAPPVAQQVKAWASEAGMLAAKHDLAQAHALLDKIEAALKGTAAGAATATATPVLQSITISPANPTLTGGWQRQFRAAGAYSDGSTKDVTTAVRWSSSAATVVEIDQKGLASAQPVSGSAIITATDASKRVTASANVTVTPDPMPTLAPEEQIKADMYADLEAGTPDVAALKALAAKPENTKILDQLVQSLDDKTPQKVFEAAIEARFGVQVHQYEHKAAGEDADVTDLSGATAVSPDLPDKSLKRVYELLSKVPASHAKDNPKLKEIVRFTADKGGGAYGDGKVYLYCGRADKTQPYQLAKPSELPTVDDDCKPKDDKKPDYFDFATLHEVGHAVDDKNGFMAKNMSGDAYGGWKTTNIEDLAKVAAKEFGYDEDYIKSKLSDEDPNPPAPPAGRTPKSWQAAQAKADTWCAGIRVGKGLWWDGAKSIALAIGDTVYQESYKGQWVSYNLAARKKGISGYQFRAPGEWFAELYAAYQSGKLKDSHPSIPWLKTL